MVLDTEPFKTEEQQNNTVTNIMADQEFSQEQVRAAHTVTLKALFETSVSVERNAKGIVHINALIQFEEISPSKVSHTVMDVLPQSAFYVTAVKASTSVTNLSKHQRISTTSPFLPELLHIKNDEYSPCPQPSSAVNFVSLFHYKLTTDRPRQMKRHETGQSGIQPL